MHGDSGRSRGLLKASIRGSLVMLPPPGAMGAVQLKLSVEYCQLLLQNAEL
jgi:hypothetical protein